MAGMLSRIAAMSIPGVDLVAVRDTHHGVYLVGIAHVLHTVGDQLTGGQGVEHPPMSHGNAVVNGNGVELWCETSRLLDNSLDPAPNAVPDAPPLAPSR